MVVIVEDRSIPDRGGVAVLHVYFETRKFIPTTIIDEMITPDVNGHFHIRFIKCINGKTPIGYGISNQYLPIEAIQNATETIQLDTIKTYF
jgi:hypothetical protein